MCENKVCPLLVNSCDYNPDTLNLNEDFEARSYWLNCFESLVDKFAVRAELSQQHDSTSVSRAEAFKTEYKSCLNELKQDKSDPFVPLTVRMLLNLNETCLRKHGFTDPWRFQKDIENKAALEVLESRLQEIDKLNNDNKWIELCKGILAGNMFDWGARAISDILEEDKNFGLQEALNAIQPRPWLMDDLETWLTRLKGRSHKCAVIFVDNSGVDIVLGVLPFARQLLLNKTQVIISANSDPSLNDITHNELLALLNEASKICKVIEDNLMNGQLMAIANGQTGPCLDLANLNPVLTKAMVNREVDLIIIEGMGRALHTNLHAEFTCESLKLAVVKNKWWATRLGGDMFSVIFQYSGSILPKNQEL